MGNSVFNLKNQSLNANILTLINQYNSNNYGGVIINDETDDIITDNGSGSITISNATYMGNGIAMAVDEYSHILSSKDLLCLHVTLSSTDSRNLISGNDVIEYEIISNTTITSAPMRYYYIPVEYPSGSPADNNWYEYDSTSHSFNLSTDVEVDSTKVYYIFYESSNVSFTYNSNNKVYDGSAITISNNEFIIPICYYSGTELIKIVLQKNLKSFKEKLSDEAYSALKDYCEKTFVWRKGGETFGDIGNLNITDEVIKNKNGGLVKIINPQFDIQNTTAIEKSILTVNSDGTVNNFISNLPITNGGTGADNKKSAKTNLGISYGTASASSRSGSEGDIYFRIV